MSRESTDKDMALTEEQLRGIWAAAQASPGSTGAQSEPPQSGAESGAAANTAVKDTPAVHTGFESISPDLRGERSVQPEMTGTPPGLHSLKEEIGVEETWFSPSMDPGPSTYPDLAQYLSAEYRCDQPSPPFHTSPGRAANTPPSVQSWHNLLYQ